MKAASLILVALVTLPVGSVMTEARVGNGSNPTEAVAEFQPVQYEVPPELAAAYLMAKDD